MRAEASGGGVRVEEAREALARLSTGSHGAIRLELDGPVARLCLDHPEARSAMSLSMMVELADAVLQLERWDGSLIVLSSADPRAFCSGGFLGEITRAASGPEAAATMCLAMGAVLGALRDLPAISVAAIDGAAIGGGAELTTATDFRVAGAEARFHFVHARLGIAPGWGGAGRLAAIVGRQAALRLMLDARPVGPGEAAHLGLVDHRCDGSAVDGTLQWLQGLLSLAPASVRAIKQQVVSAQPTPRAEGEASPFASVWGGPAHREALAGLVRHQR